MSTLTDLQAIKDCLKEEENWTKGFLAQVRQNGTTHVCWCLIGARFHSGYTVEDLREHDHDEAETLGYSEWFDLEESDEASAHEVDADPACRRIADAIALLYPDRHVAPFYAEPKPCERIARFNDHPDTTFGELHIVLDRAIEDEQRALALA